MPRARSLPALLAALALAGAGCDSGDSEPAAGPLALSLGLPPDPVNWLMVIGVEQGLFADHGLELAVRDYVSGKRALNAVLAGEVEVATTAEVPLVFRAFERSDFACFGTVGSSGNEPRVVARRDAGIAGPGDLRGKGVATQRGSAVHFFLHLFLVTHGMTEADVELSFMKAEELAPALAEGRIDAFSMREPFVSEAERLLGEGAIVFAEPGLYHKSFNLVAGTDVVARRGEALRRLVAGVLDAERFARARPGEAQALVARRLGIDAARVAELWGQIDLRLGLSQELLLAMEDEARWALAAGLVEGSEPPDFLRLLHGEPLRRVRPAAVTVVELGDAVAR